MKRAWDYFQVIFGTCWRLVVLIAVIALYAGLSWAGDEPAVAGPWWERFAAAVVPIALSTFAYLLSVGMARANKWLRDKQGMESLAAAGEVVSAAVNEAAATAVKEAIEKSKDGKLPIKDGLEIKEKVVAQVKAQLPASVTKAATRMVGDMDVWVRGKIEQEVSAAKTPAG